MIYDIIIYDDISNLKKLYNRNIYFLIKKY